MLADKDKPTRPSHSCAECRRLKLKCSRTPWPCTSCEKRGCAQICPNGTIKTGKGKRLILADTEELALAKSHALSSTQPHPLLSETYLFSPRDRKEEKPVIDDDDTVDSAFGTLTIGAGGQARFVGSFAGSEYLRTASAESETREGFPTPPHSAAAMSTIPLSVSGLQVQPGVDVEALRKQLPDWAEEGETLIKNYWDNVGWMYLPMPRSLLTNFAHHVYDSSTPVDPHKLACVFLVMALGVMFDLHRLPFDQRREHLFTLGQASLGALGLEHSSPATIRALHLCGTYILNDKHGSGGEIFWPICGTAIKIAYSLGLHRDGTVFGLSESETEERRSIWWELVLYDRLQAMCFARPAGVSNRDTDTKLPTLSLEDNADQFHVTKLRLAVLMEKVIDVQTRVAPVPYSLVTQIDAELEEFKSNIPEPLMPGTPIHELPLDPSIPPHQVIHRLGIRLLVAQSRLLLSRPFFTRALAENPSDPSFSKHGSSFVSLYESAQEIVFLVKQLVMYHPSLIARWWFFWFHAFSSACCLAAIVIKAPVSPFASPAFTGLCTVFDISRAAREGCRAKKGLPVLFRLKVRAEQALRDRGRMGDISSARRPRVPPSKVVDEGEDDLSHLDGSGKLRRTTESDVRSRPSPTMPNPRLNAPTPPGELVSPLSSASIATSTTLADQAWEGIVPPPPPMGNFGFITPITPGNSLQQQQAMAPLISPSISTSTWSGYDSGTSTRPALNHASSSNQQFMTSPLDPILEAHPAPLYNEWPAPVGTWPFEMDSDMSMALGTGVAFDIDNMAGGEWQPGTQTERGDPGWDWQSLLRDSS